MTILIIGGTGKLGLSLARTLKSTRGQAVLLTSRRAKPDTSTHVLFKDFCIVQFDWHDRSTFMKPFNYISYYREEVDENLTPIDRVFLIVPISIDILDHMKPFIEIAIEQGVKRFVLVSSTSARKGEPGLGEVHEYIESLGMDWCVLRTGWFMENFLTSYRAVIRDHNCIPSVSGGGKVAFVSIDDVIQPACAALLDSESHNKDEILVGPELLSYDETAEIFSRVLGRPIKHQRETATEHAKLCKMVCLGEIDAGLLTKYDSAIAHGSDEAICAEKNKILGEKHLEDFVRSNKRLWEKPKEDMNFVFNACEYQLDRSLKCHSQTHEDDNIMILRS